MSHTKAATAAATIAGGELFGLDMLGAVGNREVIYFTDYGNHWHYGIVVGAGTKLASVYNQLSDNGVPSVLYVSGRLRGTFQFRLAQPEEYAGIEFSYGYKPAGQFVH